MTTKNNGKSSYSPLLDQMFGRQGSEGRIVDWTGVDRVLLGDLVAGCSEVGCAVLFGFTRDRGAWALTFFWDGFQVDGSKTRSKTVYCNSQDMLESWVEEWISNWAKIAQAAT